MSVLIVDDKKLEITVRSKVGETFTPDEEVNRLAVEAREINKIRLSLNDRLTKLMSDCHEWNRSNDKLYEENVQKQLKKMEISKSQEQINKSGDSTNIN